MVKSLHQSNPRRHTIFFGNNFHRHCAVGILKIGKSLNSLTVNIIENLEESNNHLKHWLIRDREHHNNHLPTYYALCSHIILSPWNLKLPTSLLKLSHYRRLSTSRLVFNTVFSFSTLTACLVQRSNFRVLTKTGLYNSCTSHCVFVRVPHT